MELEMKQMSITSGLVYAENPPKQIVPLVSCDISHLEYGAPRELVDTLKLICEKI